MVINEFFFVSTKLDFLSRIMTILGNNTHSYMFYKWMQNEMCETLKYFIPFA
jgi:hypothetical protein